MIKTRLAWSKDQEDLAIFRKKQENIKRHKFVIKKRQNDLPELIISNREILHKVDKLLFPKTEEELRSAYVPKRTFIAPTVSFLKQINYMLEAKELEKNIVPFKKDSTYYKFVRQNRPIKTLVSSLEMNSATDKEPLKSPAILRALKERAITRKSMPELLHGMPFLTTQSNLNSKRNYDLLRGTTHAFNTNNKERYGKTANDPRINTFYTQIIYNADLVQSKDSGRLTNSRSIPFFSTFSSFSINKPKRLEGLH